MQKTSVYRDDKINTTIIIFLLSAMMIGFSIYLTQHYFDLKFPTGLEGKSICNINQFFSCDKTTLSVFGNILGVPISVGGIVVGLLTMGGLIFKNEDYERSIYFSLAANFIGCIILFLFSLIILHGLCPFCTLYYIASGLIFLFFFRKSQTMNPHVGYLASFAVIGFIFFGLFKMNVSSKEAAQSEVSNDVIKQYYALADLGAPKIKSPFKLATVENAPIRMVIFSDFECPACKALSEIVPQLISRYEGKIDIQYFFYPLDNSCNPSMPRPLHQFACKAAFIANCMPADQFGKVHDELFSNQEKFEHGFLDQYIKDNKLEACVTAAATKEKVVSLINESGPFNVRSTPTWLLNGVKIEGVLPPTQMFAIMDEILRRAGK